MNIVHFDKYAIPGDVIARAESNEPGADAAIHSVCPAKLPSDHRAPG